MPCASLNDMHGLSFGEPNGVTTPRIDAINAALTSAGFDARLSVEIMQAMWEKWIFIASLAGITCLMRASIGDIVAAGGSDIALQLADECSGIAAASGFAPRAAARERNRAILTAGGSALTASMLRDVERGAKTEGEHVLGDLLRRGTNGKAVSILRAAYTHVAAYYEIRRITQPKP